MNFGRIVLGYSHGQLIVCGRSDLASTMNTAASDSIASLATCTWIAIFQQKHEYGGIVLDTATASSLSVGALIL